MNSAAPAHRTVLRGLVAAAPITVKHGSGDLMAALYLPKVQDTMMRTVYEPTVREQNDAGGVTV